jgi:hypothetical protein
VNVLTEGAQSLPTFPTGLSCFSPAAQVHELRRTHLSSGKQV